jgi:hypothetical protein
MSIKWTGDLASKLQGGERKAFQYLAKTTQYYSLMGEANMKKRARWTDRSSNARNGLTGLYYAKGGASSTFEIDLFYTVSYGIYLEGVRFRRKGKLAVIQPTIDHVGPKFYVAAGKVLGRIFS